jgi:hypothetical protein
MIKRVITASIILLVFSFCSLLGQGSSCPKIRVGVKIAEVYPEVFDHLNKVYKTEKHRAVWLTELGELLMKSLRENSPDLEFIYLSGSPNADYDYLFSTLIALTGGGKDIVVMEEYTIIEGENIFTIPPVYGSEYTVYKVWSSLIVNSNCFPNRRYILGIESGESEDIYRAILSSISGFGRGIDYTLFKRENERPVPPREPNVETRLDKEYISLLTEETRKVKIYENVKSCNGVPSYFPVGYHSQPVRFPVKTDRGKFDATENCKVEYSNSEVQYILLNAAGDAVGEYTVQRGLEPLLEKITLSTCPLGNKPNIEKEVEIAIRGLKLLVEPERKTIYNGENTTITIDLHELDPDGTKYPGFRQEVEVKVTGLVDSTITHKSGKIALDDEGIAWIDYKAGQKDKQIRISATFTPPGYPEEVKGEAIINVKPLDYEATLTIRGRFTNTENSSYSRKQNDGIERGNYSLFERTEASFYVPLKLENSGDMPMFNQRWEYYQPLDINLSSFNASYRLKDYEYSSHGNYGFEKTRTINKNPVNRKISEKNYLLQSNIILIIDKETSKVVKIVTGGFPVEFHWDQIEKTTGRSWSPDGSEPIEHFSHKTDDMSTQYAPGPVEDPISDPTLKSVSESLRTYLKKLGTPLPADVEIPEDTEDKAEIPPDLLVEFGDGKTFFGGDGKKVIDKSKGSNIDREEHTFFWQVTRKKKSL